MTNESLFFIGRFHPLIVHLPIGFLIIGLILELVGVVIKKYQSLQVASGFVLLLGAAGAIVSAVVGYLLSLEGDFEGTSFVVHKWTGIAVAVFSSITYVIKEHMKPFIATRIHPLLYRGLWFFVVLLLSVAGHMGGNMTHGEDYLLEYAPEFIKKASGIEEEDFLEEEEGDQLLNQAVDSLGHGLTSVGIETNEGPQMTFKQDIYPILKKKCVSCHSNSKKKGGLSMLGVSAMLKGGKHGASLVPFDAQKSNVIKRVSLSKKNKLFMPPNGKPALSSLEKELITTWIELGAKKRFTLGASNTNLAQQIESQPVEKEEIEEVSFDDTEHNNVAFYKKFDLASFPEIKQLDDQGIMVKLIDVNSPNRYEVILSYNKAYQLTEMLEGLEQLKDKVVWLDVSNQKEVASRDIELIAGLSNLERLRLDNTNVACQLIEPLNRLKKLSYLNLYNTAVTDSCSILKVKKQTQLFI